MNEEVRRVVKRRVRKHAQTFFAWVSRDHVSIIGLRVKIGGVWYEAVGTAKWHKPDVYNEAEGLRRAYKRTVVELVDRVLDPQRRTLSVKKV